MQTTCPKVPFPAAHREIEKDGALSLHVATLHRDDGWLCRGEQNGHDNIQQKHRANLPDRDSRSDIPPRFLCQQAMSPYSLMPVYYGCVPL